MQELLSRRQNQVDRKVEQTCALLVACDDLRGGINCHLAALLRNRDSPPSHIGWQAAQNASPTRPQPRKIPEAYPLGYVEDFFEARTKLAGVFSSLLNGDDVGHDGMQPARASRLGTHDLGNLHVAFDVGGLDDDLELAGLRCAPAVVPDHPGIG